MDQPLYRFLEWTAGESGLMWLVQGYQKEILFFVAVLALACCLFGFYCYRGVVSGLVFLGVTLASNLWIRPQWGAQAAVTACAVLGVVVGFLAFRWYRLGGVLLCALIAGSWVWQLTGASGQPALGTWALIALAAIAAGAAAFWFPLWSICGFTAVWGAAVFAGEGWRVWSALPGPEEQVWSAVLAAALAAVGLVLQLRLFHRQTLFPRIMPKSMEYRLQRKREKKEVAV